MEEHSEFFEDQILDLIFERWSSELTNAATAEEEERLMKMALTELAEVGGENGRHYVMVAGWLLDRYTESGNTAEAANMARDYWSKMLGFYPDSPETWLAWAVGLDREGRTEEALSLVKTAMRYLVESVRPEVLLMADARGILSGLLAKKEDANGFKLLNYEFPGWN